MNKTDEALANILTKLADKLGTTVGHLYAIMIKQAFIDGIESIFIFTVCTIIFISLYIKFSNQITKEEAKNEDTWEIDRSEIWIVFKILIIIAWVAISFFSLLTAIDCFFNPEYYALHQIIK